jgi:MerR family transcriptional regulator, light-induced transcriptional regulator
MQDHQLSLVGRRPERDATRKDPGDAGVIDFASWVVALLAARKSSADTAMRSDLLAAFRLAAIDESPAALEVFLRDLVRQKVSAASVADLYIPALARQLGDDWLEDRVSFMEVTLASSRMQAMLRAIGAAWTADLAGPRHPATLLLIVPAHEQHTLGAMVLLGQLRRMGVSVRLSVAPETAELRGLLSAGQYDAVLISASSMARLADLRAVVQEVRRHGPRGQIVAVGGHILQSGVDVAAATGADLATCDPATVFEACGIRVDLSGARLRA